LGTTLRECWTGIVTGKLTFSDANYDPDPDFREDMTHVGRAVLKKPPFLMAADGPMSSI